MRNRRCTPINADKIKIQIPEDMHTQELEWLIFIGVHRRSSAVAWI
jgi:hypothetical protein